MKTARPAALVCALLLGPGLFAGAARATSYTLTTTVTTDGVQSLAGGTLAIYCRTSSGAPWTSCGSSVDSGTEVSVDAVASDGYWFMWFTTNPYLAGCSTTNWGWGYHANPETHCGFTMPTSNVNLNAEFQLP